MHIQFPWQLQKSTFCLHVKAPKKGAGFLRKFSRGNDAVAVWFFFSASAANSKLVHFPKPAPRPLCCCWRAARLSVSTILLGRGNLTLSRHFLCDSPVWTFSRSTGTVLNVAKRVVTCFTFSPHKKYDTVRCSPRGEEERPRCWLDRYNDSWLPLNTKLQFPPYRKSGFPFFKKEEF